MNGLFTSNFDIFGLEAVEVDGEVAAVVGVVPDWSCSAFRLAAAAFLAWAVAWWALMLKILSIYKLLVVAAQFENLKDLLVKSMLK